MPDIQNNFVQSKMNQDLDDRLIPQGEYRSAQNVAISRSQGEDVGALENIEGNSIVANPLLPTDPNLDVIGYFVDPSENNVYLFYTDYVDTSSDFISNFAPSTAKCIIYQYNNLGAGTWSKLVEGRFLNFSKNSPIYGVSIIENLLFFTDYRNQPRKINVSIAANDDSYYQNEDQISVAKFAPVNPVRFVDMAYNNKLKSTISNPSQEFLPINIASTINGNQSVTNQVTINSTGFVPSVGSKIVSIGAPILNDKIVTASTATLITFSPTVSSTSVTGNEDIAFQQPNPDYNADWAGDPDYVKDRFIRFSYRFKFDDGEYSIMAPFSQSCFVPKQSGYFVSSQPDIDAVSAKSNFAKNDAEQTYRSTVVSFMENNATDVDLNIEMPSNNIETSLRVSAVEILYKESDQISIKSVETIPIEEVNKNMSSNANINIFTYKYLSTKPYKVLPEDQTTRVYDKVPVRAFSQETSSNRIIYGNYIDKHSSPDFLNYGLGFADKTQVNTGSPDANVIYSQIEYPNHTLKQNRNYQLGVVLADKYGRSSTTILSSKDVSSSENTVQYGSSTIYVPYKSWSSPSASSGVTSSLYKWPGDSLSVLFDNKKGSLNAIPVDKEDGYPGVYIPIGAAETIVVLNGGVGYSSANNVTTTGGTGSGLTVNITVTGSAITSVEIAKMGEGYSDGDTINIDGVPGANGTATITGISEPNLLGWYSYKFVVRQTEQDYYNVYVPGILSGYPFESETILQTPFEINETSNIVLFNDNINKIPRDLSEVGPDQKIFQSSVRLFGRVEPFDSESSTFSVQYNPPSTPVFAASVSTLGETNYKNDAGVNLTYESFYNSESNPYIARLTTAKKIGKIDSSSGTFGLALSVFETAPVESVLDIYWETTSVGLVEDLNLEVKQSQSAGGVVSLSSTTAAQNESNPINAAVFGDSGSLITPLNSSGTLVTGQNFSIISATRNTLGGNSVPLLAKSATNADITPFVLVTSGSGFYVQTNGFFDISPIAAENNYALVIRVQDNSTLVFIDFTINWTLTNTVPSFGTVPGPYIIQGDGPIPNSDYSTNAVNGVNTSASSIQQKEDLSFSIAANTVTKGGVTDPNLNNYGFSIEPNGPIPPSTSMLIQNNAALTTADNGDYIIPIILTDAGGLTATTNATVNISIGLQVGIDLQINNNSTTYSGNIDMQAEFIYSGNGTPVSQTLQASSTSSNPFGTAVGLLNLQPQPTGNTSETITVNVRRQTGGVPAQVPNPDTLTISVFAEGISTTTPLLQTTIQSPQTITDVGTITLPHLAPSTGTNNILTGTDITTNNTLGFSVVIDLA